MHYTSIYSMLVAFSVVMPLSTLSPSYASAAALECTPEQNAEVFRQTNDSLDLSCLPVFDQNNTHITRPIVIAGDQLNGATLDCDGGAIGDGDARVFTIRSSTDVVPAVNQYGHFEHIFSDIDFLKTSQWKLPQNITIKNCHINGGARIYGAGRNGQAATVKLSSHHLDHTARLRAIAPRDIFFENIEFSVSGSTSLYVSPGVHHIQVYNSIFRGVTDRMAVYLDAESAYNRFVNNTFDLQSIGKREVISVDGSSDNVFERNILKNLSKGGVYVYRNCGESGVVRHNTPERNTFRNNIFEGETPSSPFVWLGSRQGKTGFCPDDKGFGFGSSIDDMDYADHNILDANIVPSSAVIRDNGANNTITNSLSQRKEDILYGYLTPQATPPSIPAISHGGPSYLPTPPPDATDMTDAEEVVPYTPPALTPVTPLTPVITPPAVVEESPLPRSDDISDMPPPEPAPPIVLFDNQAVGSTWNYGTAQNPIYGSMGMPTVFVWSWNYGTTDAPVYYQSAASTTHYQSAAISPIASAPSMTTRDGYMTPSQDQASGFLDTLIQIFIR